MTLSITLILNILLSFSGLFGLFQTITKISFPQKWVWFVGFSIITAVGICNSLYQYGGVYIVLLPALYPLKSTLETTATLGLIIGVYSLINNDQISSHWYSLPTGCTPITMLAQYYPTYYIQFVFVALLLGYILVKAQTKVYWVIPLALLVFSTIVQIFKVRVFTLTYSDVGTILLTASTLAFAILSTGGKIQVGKNKIG